MVDQPKWLNEEEQVTWRRFIAAQAKIHEGLDRQLQRDAGLPPGYYQIMAMLSESEGRQLRMLELARMVQSSQSRLTHAVNRLEENGWVLREKAAADGRGRTVFLTEDGWQKVKDSAPGHVAEVRKLLFDRLTCDQIKDLRQVCEAILDEKTPS